MEYIRVTKENIENEHICCAISSNKDIQVISKKNWLKERFDDGLVFLKSIERGKCFIEYIPAENAWNPINADGYMYIDCLWVAGSFKGNGYSTDLLNACIEDSKAKGKKGICILSAAKKKPFLADPKFLKYKDFTICDEADNGIQLWYLPFSLDAAKPEFKECAKHPHIEQTGYVLYYTNQCPFNAKYVPVLLEVARERAVPFQANRLETKEEAQNAPTPVTTYALFYNGEYLRFLYKGIIIKHNKTEPTYTKTSLFLCEKRRFLWPGLRKEGNLFKLAGPGGLAFFHLTKKEVSKWPMKK